MMLLLSLGSEDTSWAGNKAADDVCVGRYELGGRGSGCYCWAFCGIWFARDAMIVGFDVAGRNAFTRVFRKP